MRGQDFLEALEVARDDLQDEIDLSVEHMALADLWNFGDMRLERGEIVLSLASQLHHGEHRDRKAEAGGIKVGVISTDHTGLFERTHAAQAGRGGQPDAFGQLDIGHPAVLLQVGENLTIDPIEGHCVTLSENWPIPIGEFP